MRSCIAKKHSNTSPLCRRGLRQCGTAVTRDSANVLTSACRVKTSAVTSNCFLCCSVVMWEAQGSFCGSLPHRLCDDTPQGVPGTCACGAIDPVNHDALNCDVQVHCQQPGGAARAAGLCRLCSFRIGNGGGAAGHGHRSGQRPGRPAVS